MSTIAISALTILVGTVSRFEIERFWDTHAVPLLGANISGAIESMTGFVGGVIVTLLFLVVSDYAIRNGKKINRVTSTVSLSAVARNQDISKPTLQSSVHEESDTGEMMRVEIADADIIPAGMILRGTLSDDGVDVVAIIQYRNRSKTPIAVKPLRATFRIGERKSKSRGISTPLPKETTASIHFIPIRIYNQDDPTGNVEFRVAFGRTSSSIRTVLVMKYEFQIRSYPPNKSTDSVLNADISEEIYYERRPDGATII